jgi:autotransporter-associated beta strand protein
MSSDIITFNGYNGTSSYGSNGTITISSGNTSVTSGGANDGQASGLLRGGNFIKTGAGVFVINGSNTYTGSTTISGGTLRLGSTNSIPTGTSLTVTGALDLGGFSQTVSSLSGSGPVSRSGSGNLVLTVSPDCE